jgi:UDP-N-acetyl-2-amino-2-deoxyglucuronate dehydrogenase
MKNNKQTKNFAIIGASGYIAPRHMKAIEETGNNLVAILDKNDSVGIIDTYFPKAELFLESEMFDRHMYKLKDTDRKIDYISICSPNYLHDAHIRLALRNDADVICEKPLVLNPWNIDELMKLEIETGRQINNILQLRLHPSVIELKEKIDNGPSDKTYEVTLDYITSRGNWYLRSWKNKMSKSGGIATNIGIHFFDMLIWIFGNVKNSTSNHSETSASGYLELDRANVTWKLSIDSDDLPLEYKQKGLPVYRSICIDDSSFEFSTGFTDLHTKSYEKILIGEGFKLRDAIPSVELAYKIRNNK